VKGEDGDGDNLPDLDAAKDDTQVGADAEAEVHLVDCHGWSTTWWSISYSIAKMMITDSTNSGV
jgi:hypothetical protein